MLRNCIEIAILRMPKLFWPKPFAMINQHVRFGGFDKLFNEILVLGALLWVIEQAGYGGVNDNIDCDFACTQRLYHFFPLDQTLI